MTGWLGDGICDQGCIDAGCDDSTDCVNATTPAVYVPGASLADLQCATTCPVSFEADGTCDEVRSPTPLATMNM